jgi:putative membrane protein
MTRENSAVRTILTVGAVLFAIPLLIMGVVMPLVVLTGVAHVPFGFGGWQILMPVVPLFIFGTLVYALYTGVGEQSEERTGELEALRLAYARGELSEPEFENRRARLQSQAKASLQSEASTDE